MDFNDLRELIAANQEVVDFAEFGEGTSQEWIDLAQKRLGVSFPPSYIWWLKNYGGGEINGEEVFSVYEQDFDTVVGGDIVYINELNRKNGTSENYQLVIQENDQGETYYLDLRKRNGEDECPVFIDLNEEEYADSFLNFLSKKIIE